TGRGGALASGTLGGLVSSTATTVSFATRSGKRPALAPVAAVIILVASAVVYLRVVVEALVVAPPLLSDLAGPLAAFVLLFAVAIAVYVLRIRHVADAEVESGNPAELPAALFFGAVYSVVIFVSAAVSEHFGETMLYPVAVLSGLTDVDAITLSTARLYAESRISPDTAWRVIFVASLANLVFKAGIVAVVGGAALRRRLLPVLGGLAMAGVVLVVVWP
ncbi:MAG: MgtC/SapB family protein, partial [Pseudomonadales bacterium]